MHRLVPIVLLAACAGANPATPETPASAPTEAAEAPAGPIAGGWSEADPASDRIKTAASKIEALLRVRTSDPTLAITGVTSAKTQVVAGTNYALVLDVTGAGGARTGVSVVAWQNPQDEWEVTSVEGL